jgi:two-component system, sensor histidine kinase and response regulator
LSCDVDRSSDQLDADDYDRPLKRNGVMDATAGAFTMSPSSFSRSTQSRRAVLLLACLAFAVLFSAPAVFGALSSSITVLLVVPIAAVANEYGRRGGVLTGVLAIALLVALDLLSSKSVSAAAYVSRSVAFVLVGWLVGQMAERLRTAARNAAAAAQHFALARDLMATANFDGYFVALNRQWQTTLGWTPDELRSRPFIEFVHPDDRASTLEEAAKLSVGGTTVSFVNRYRTKDGDWRFIEWSAHGEPDHGLIYAAARDVTERQITEQARREAEEALREAAARAVEASRLKSDFVANMSHEIRTPLNGVIGMADLMLDTDMTNEQRAYAESLRVSADALMSVIDDILDFSKIEAGRLELEAIDFDVREMVDAACALVAQAAYEKDVELIAWCDPAVPHAARADGVRIRQVLSNLLSNAVKFTSEGEVVVRVNREPGDGTQLRFEVVDTGIGIEADALGRLFEPFSQADSSTTRTYGGTGLGLTICKQLVQRMGGAIGVESAPGEGSTFWFVVPVVEADAAVGVPRPVELSGVRALVVDDNETNRTILASQLASWGMECDSATNAQEALGAIRMASAEGRPYALALIDFHMAPGIDGVELAAAIRRTPALRAMRLIVLSSAGAGRAAADGVHIDGFLTKPVAQHALRAEIVRVMGIAPAHDEGPAPTVSAVADARADGPLVLVAEDNPVNQRVAIHRLERAGCRVDVANDGLEAVRKSEATRYGAIFMDVQMPVMDGFAATQAIRRREGEGPRTPIVAVTAHTVAGDEERCLAAGMDDYISKPLRAESVERALARWVFSPSDERREVVDLAALETTCAGDNEVRAEFVTLFLEHSRGELDALREAVAGADARRAATIAHSLGGSAATVGGVRLAETCSRLSQPAAWEPGDEMVSALEDVERAYAATRARLRILVDEDAPRFGQVRAGSSSPSFSSPRSSA